MNNRAIHRISLPTRHAARHLPLRPLRVLLISLLLISAVGRRSDADDKPPYPPSSVIAGFQLDWSTHQRHAPGSDNWPMTWADDNHQYTAWGDGGGFGGTNSDGRVSLGIARIEGSWSDYRGRNIWGGKNGEAPARFGGKSYGILSVGGLLYLWHSPDPAPHLNETRLAWSKDRGRSWQRADWAFTFDDGLTIPTFLNFGRDYGAARDDYVYSYYIHPRYGPGPSRSPLAYEGRFDVHRPGTIYLSRVPKAHILDRSRYEFFAGLDAQGRPQWSDDLAAKQPVFSDPNGVGWNVSVSYNAGLGLYLLCTEHSRTHLGKLGIFDAREPWGPWTTVAYEDAWGAGQVSVNTFYWSFPTKWMSDDGRDVTFQFTGRTENDSYNTIRGRFELHDRE